MSTINGPPPGLRGGESRQHPPNPFAAAPQSPDLTPGPMVWPARAEIVPPTKCPCNFPKLPVCTGVKEDGTEGTLPRQRPKSTALATAERGLVTVQLLERPHDRPTPHPNTPLQHNPLALCVASLAPGRPGRPGGAAAAFAGLFPPVPLPPPPFFSRYSRCGPAPPSFPPGGPLPPLPPVRAGRPALTLKPARGYMRCRCAHTAAAAADGGRGDRRTNLQPHRQNNSA